MDISLYFAIFCAQIKIRNIKKMESGEGDTREILFYYKWKQKLLCMLSLLFSSTANKLCLVFAPFSQMHIKVQFSENFVPETTYRHATSTISASSKKFRR